jgi:hypothetical protein
MGGAAVNQIPYNFDDSLRKYEIWEQKFCAWLTNYGYKPRPATLEEQKGGADLILVDLAGRTISADIKADDYIHQTGNVFVELFSVFELGVASWMWSKSQWIVYISTKTGHFWIINKSKLKAKLTSAGNGLKVRFVPNQRRDGSRYMPLGILVPVAWLKDIGAKEGDL